MKTLTKALGIVGIVGASLGFSKNSYSQYSEEIGIENNFAECFVQCDFKNNLVKVITYTGGSKHIHERRFNEKGNMVEEDYRKDDKNDGTFDYRIQTILKYDKKGNMIRHVNLVDKENDGKFDERWEYDRKCNLQNAGNIILENNETIDIKKHK